MKTLKLVEEFNSRTDVVKCTFLTDNLSSQTIEVETLIDAIVMSAEEDLITAEGRSNTSNVGRMILCGVAVTCGERDSFGWLTGVIHTKHGQIVYG